MQTLKAVVKVPGAVGRKQVFPVPQSALVVQERVLSFEQIPGPAADAP